MKNSQYYVNLLTIKIRYEFEKIKEYMRSKLAGNSFISGAGALEVIIITVILLGLALIFRKEIWGIFENVQNELSTLGNNVDDIKFSEKL